MDCKRNLTLLTDLYQLTMMNGYLQQERREEIAVFDVFFRQNGMITYSIACGLEQVVDYILNLNFGEDEISYSHERDTSFNFPVCEGAEENYYTINQLCDADDYDYVTTKSIITKQLDDDYIVVKYSSPEECQKAVKDLFDNNKIFKVSNRFDRIKYFVSNTGNAIYIIEA